MRPHPKVEIHPETAKKYDINDGDEIVIETRNGKITQVVNLTDTVDPRIINASHGWWFPEESPESQYGWEKSNLNMLTSAGKLGKEYGTPNLKGIGCRIGRKE
jgi:anaerobic selenocysteine-containing dehydrogenase